MMARLAHSIIRKLILGKKEFILSRSEYKRVLLTGQLSLIVLAVCISYLVFDLSMGIYQMWPYQAGCVSIILFILWLNRNRRYEAAKILFGLTVHTTVFLFTSAETIVTGIFMFHIATSLCTFAIFGYEERGKGFLFVAFSISLFILSYISDMSVLPSIPQNENYIRMNIIINFIVSLLGSILILYFLIKVNYRTETALRENEVQITDQNRELMKVNGELDRFVYSTSHDLRAPLSSIQGLINLTAMTNNTDEIRSYIAMMKGRVLHLDKFINDISDYSRNSRLDVKKTKIFLKKILMEVLESLHYFPHSERIEVVLDIPDELYIVSDGTRLQMILTNLISNSFKYHDATKEKPHVVIKARPLSSTFIELEIKDNGIGIPEELQPKIFDMFFQAHESSKGSGLGLYIVKETMEKLEGIITVKSIVGKGTSFIVHLPAQ